MFSSGDLNSPPPQKPFYSNRLLGGLLLAVAAVFILTMVLSLDAAVFVPFNATYAVTQTWQAAHPATSTPKTSPKRTSNPRRSATPEQGDSPTEAF
jgi:hypothetical protein